MEARKKTANSFGVFLDSVNRQKVSERATAAMQSGERSVEAEGSQLESEILKLVAQSVAPLSVKLVISELDIAPSLVMTALAQLASAKLVKMASSEKDETVAITELGKKLTY